jgi:uncharacterized membrane protein
MKTKSLLQIIIFLSVIGILVSIYLTLTHFNPALGSEVCGIEPGTGCSAVNTSEYSVVFGVPAGIMGIIWFVILGVFAGYAYKHQKFARKLLGWTSVGMLFVGYFVYAEIQLAEICKFCTVIHIIVVITFIVSWMLHYRAKK